MIITSRSQPPYDDLISIARLLGAEASSVASCNNTSSNDHAGAKLKVEVGCACPSAKQMENGVISLLTYMVTWNDTVTLIGEKFGVDVHSVLDANMFSWSSTIYPFTPILVPLKHEICTANPVGTKSLCPGWGDSGDFGCICGSKRFKGSQVILGVCLGTVFLCMFPLGYKLHQFLKRRRCKIRKEKFFKQNGGYLLQQKFHANNTTVLAKIFTAEELQEAADNLNESRFLGQGGYGTVYKGMLLDGSTVAVKRSKCGDTSCLYLIPNKSPKHTLSWDTRLRIACEVAGAVAYMHSAASSSILHRDIKSPNVLLDDKFSAKGTFGYIDPEYFQSNRFTEKSDVYSFGRRDDGRNLMMHFVSLAKENQLHQILDPRLAGEAEPKDIDAIARLATRCLRSNGKRRPTMREDSIVSTYELGFTSTLESARCGRVFM
ncbi:hypothetical protein PRUPE_6G357000 [Prunus persica]|uniref:Protein kinase domain-containing protein n=1 Tax=Prunus persica TaxID=3760 RepID=A0A251P269_PRUPE|nr:hypothetical protein PRUPE_6G357000 [Prunus persica]